MKLQSILKCFAVVVLLGTLGLTGCTSENPVSPAPDQNKPQISKVVKTTSSAGVQIFSNLSSFSETSQLIGGQDEIIDLEIPEMENPEKAMAFAKVMQQRTWARLPLSKSNTDIQSAAGDSVIWDLEFEENGITYRSKLVYDPTNGKAHFFLVGKQFPESHPVAYDSTDVRADLNSTLLDDSDDVLERVDLLKRYKPDQLIQEETASFVPDSYQPGTEPTGGTLTSDISYSSSSFLTRTGARFEYHEGSGGSYSKESVFNDNSKSLEEVTFKEDGTGTLLEQRRDGTKIEGEFDSADDDGEGSFSLTTTFPAGHDPVSVSESGSYVVNAADSTISGSFEREVTNLDGSKDSEKVTITQQRLNDVFSTRLDVENSDGSRGFIEITETPDVEDISGEWRNADGTFETFAAQGYSDGSAHLEGKVYTSEADFKSRADPVATFVFDFYPDGSGNGVVTEGDKTYDVTINPDGSVDIKERT
ncbi:MAG: hypothetical protein ACE5IR_12485 [bacterium]